jgi:hypothetical protein
LFSGKVKMDTVKVKERNFSGRGRNALYERIYQDGSQDRFSGFYAFREKIYDAKPVTGGLLYFPFLEFIIPVVWKLCRLFSGNKKSI